MADTPASNSPLSSLSSEDFPEDNMDGRVEDPDASSAVWSDNDLALPPSKRRRIAHVVDEPILDNYLDDASAISSDTEGSAPPSPSQRNMRGDDDEGGKEYLQICKWDGCDAGDLGNQDNLVEHIHEAHIGSKKAVYKCGWSDCMRKGQAHASAYALRAHMRSHTKEKPFYCALPECDRCFTRSDALAKHMRTVHETEALRSTDNPPSTKRRGASPPRPSIRLKLNFKTKSPSTSHVNEEYDSPPDGELIGDTPLSPTSRREILTPPPPELQFTPAELELAPRELFRLLRRQLHWVQQEADQLAGAIDTIQEKHRAEWLAKELVLENVLEGEYQSAGKKGVLKEDGDQIVLSMYPGDEGDEDEEVEQPLIPMTTLAGDAVVASRLPMAGPIHPWYRQAAYAPAKANGTDASGDGQTTDSGDETEEDFDADD